MKAHLVYNYWCDYDLEVKIGADIETVTISFKEGANEFSRPSLLSSDDARELAKMLEFAANHTDLLNQKETK